MYATTLNRCSNTFSVGPWYHPGADTHCGPETMGPNRGHHHSRMGTRHCSHSFTWPIYALNYDLSTSGKRGQRGSASTKYCEPDGSVRFGIRMPNAKTFLAALCALLVVPDPQHAAVLHHSCIIGGHINILEFIWIFCLQSIIFFL